MSGQHTPGPWHVETEADWEDDEPTLYVCHAGTVCDGTTVCNFPPSHWATLDTRAANARLIAAAPDLLEALREANRLLGDIPAAKGNPRVADAITANRKAIAKAEGRA
jgi:hypothetical protein